MWPRRYQDRLASWYRLRNSANQLTLDQYLFDINQWWHATPWTAYHLHWDDRNCWPDPWQLLEDNVFCSLARGLGIMYTMSLTPNWNNLDVRLVESGGDNLVVVGKSKYILNWQKDQIVNINLGPVHPQHALNLSDIIQKIA